MPDRLNAPAIKSPDQFEIKLPVCERFDLKNGAPVYYINGGAEDVMKIEWIFSAGNYFETKTGIAPAVNRLLKAGTSRLSSFEISKHFEFYGAFLSVGCYNEWAVVTLESLTRHIRELLPVVSELFRESVFPEKEIEIYKQNNKQRLEVNLTKCDFVANRKIAAMLYGQQHPYGRNSEIADIMAVQREDLMYFYKQQYQTAECKIFAAGKLPDDFAATMDEYFGSLQLNQQKEIIKVDRDPSKEKKISLTIDANGVQSAIRIGREFPNRKHPDFKKAMVLNALYGGYFGSRLMSNIREDKGYTYGIYSYLQNHIQFSSWIVTTEAGKDVAAPAVEEIYKEMDLLTREPAAPEELRLVKNYLIGHQLAALDGPFNIIDRWKSLILNGLDETYFHDTIQTIKSVTSEELLELARKYFVAEEFYELVVT